MELGFGKTSRAGQGQSQVLPLECESEVRVLPHAPVGWEGEDSVHLAVAVARPLPLTTEKRRMSFSFARPPGQSRDSSNTTTAYWTTQESLGQRSLSALGFSTDIQDDFFTPVSPNPALEFDPPPNVRSVDTGRPYPPVERRSFRDISVTGDMVGTTLDINSTSPGTASGATSRGRNTPTVGAIGDGRKPTPSPEKARTDEPVLGGVYDARGALSAIDNVPISRGSPSPARAPLSAPPSRPTSFILPSRAPSQLSTTTTEGEQHRDEHGELIGGGIANSALFHSPTSTNGPGLPHTSSASRTSSPVAIESSASAGGQTEYLTNRVAALESTVTDLSSVVHSELRSLREEVGVLRGLVLQSSSFTGGPQVPSLIPMAERETDSPLLTLRSPSPHHSPAFPYRPMQHQHSLAYLNLPAQPTTAPLTGHSGGAPPSPVHSAPGGLYQDRTQDERARTSSHESKDDQIRALEAQVSALTSSVSHLMGPSNHTPMQSPLLGSHYPLQQQQQQQQHRQLSLPPLGPNHALGSPSLGGGSPGIGSFVEGWKRDVGTGLGVSTPAGPGGARSPLMRPLSANGNVGLNRQSSIGSSYGRGGDDDRRRSQLGYGVVGQSLRQEVPVRPVPRPPSLVSWPLISHLAGFRQQPFHSVELGGRLAERYALSVDWSRRNFAHWTPFAWRQMGGPRSRERALQDYRQVWVRAPRAHLYERARD